LPGRACGFFRETAAVLAANVLDTDAGSDVLRNVFLPPNCDLEK
jgi:hypothetical protein